MRHVARQVVAVGDGQRLHQVPAREVRAAEIADLAGPDEVVERPQRLLDRRARVEAVELEQVDMVGLEPAQGGLAGLDQVEAGGAHVVGAVAHPERGFGRDQHLIAPPLDRLAQDRLGSAAGIGVGAVEHGDPGIEADVDETPRLLDLDRAERLKEITPAAEGGRAEAQDRHAKARSTQISIVHASSPSDRPRDRGQRSRPGRGGRSSARGSLATKKRGSPGRHRGAGRQARPRRADRTSDPTTWPKERGSQRNRGSSLTAVAPSCRPGG